MKWKKDHKMPNSKSKLTENLSKSEMNRKNSGNNDEYDSDSSNMEGSELNYDLDDGDNNGFDEDKKPFMNGYDCKKESSNELSHRQSFNKIINNKPLMI